MKNRFCHSFLASAVQFAMRSTVLFASLSTVRFTARSATRLTVRSAMRFTVRSAMRFTTWSATRLTVRFAMWFAVLFTVLFTAATGAQAAEKRDSLKVLAIGNSFSVCLTSYFPDVVKSAGCEILFDHLTIGGCTLERHWNNIAKEEADPTFKYFKEFTYKEKLQSQPWDIVSIQQSSPLGWKEESFFPHVQYLTDFVKQNAPTAEVVLQQTWAYRPDEPRLAKWNLTQETMYQKLISSYTNVGKKMHLRVIPVGMGIQRARENQPQGCPPFQRSDFKYPDLPKMDGFLCGNIHWNKEHTALEGDAYHLNARGKYLQACVWFAYLYGQPTEKITFVPKELTPEDAKYLRQAAQEAVDVWKF